MTAPRRSAVVRALRAAAHAELDGVLAMASAAYDEATHAESKAENQYDTRSLEASYLAAGQAVRVAALRRAAGFFDAVDDGDGNPDAQVGPGALVGIEEDGVTSWCFVAPEGGGAIVQADGVAVRVVTPASPLGEALVGAREGDGVEVFDPRPRAFEVVAVRGPG